MTSLSSVREHMKIIGADGVPVGTVDKVEDGRIKLTLEDDGVEGQSKHEGHHHFIRSSLIAGIDGDTIRLSANADVAVTFEEEEAGS